jgi:hypothetical protein
MEDEGRRMKDDGLHPSREQTLIAGKDERPAKDIAGRSRPAEAGA